MVPTTWRNIRVGLCWREHGKPARVVSAAFLATLHCFPAFAQSPQLGSEGFAPNIAAASPTGWFWTFRRWRPTLQSPDGRFTMVVRARLQLDAGTFDQSEDVGTITPERDVEFKDLQSGAMTRRAYLGIEGRAFGNFSYEYRMNFGDTRAFLTNPGLNMARVSYNVGDPDSGATHFRIDAGFIRPMFTLGDSTSSAALVFLERADAGNVATSVYGGSTPRLGVQFIFQKPNGLYRGDNFVVSGALTGGRSINSNNTIFPSNASFAGKQIISRIAYRLPFGDFDGIQLGGNASHILSVAEDAAARGTHTIRLQDFPEIRIDGNRLVSTGPLAASGGSLLGLESAVNFGSVYATGEFYRFYVQRDTHCPGCSVLRDPNFSGWYVAASWVLTGERRPYQTDSDSSTFATFGNPVVESDFSLKDRHFGAWEIAARYSDLDLNWHEGAPQTVCTGAFIGCIRGGQQNIWTFGLNWYLTNNIRMQFNYLAIDIDKLNASGQQIGQAFNAVGTRLQLTN